MKGEMRPCVVLLKGRDKSVWGRWRSHMQKTGHFVLILVSLNPSYFDHELK